MEPELIGGRYRVSRPVGRGGMGTVWLCEDELLRREVAVKQVGLLPGESATDSARALREARTSAALSHRNVVTVYDVVEEADTLHLVMEYVPSRSLAEMIEQDGPLDPALVARIGAQVADGLAAAHAVGITHRDVKPGNVLVSEDGTAKISDFGIARATREQTLTQSGFVTGTPSYFSPELARGAHPDPSADVWALGATLYAAVEGRPLYQKRANPVAVLHDIATTLPTRPSRAGDLEQPLMRMLDRDPDSRWSMAAAAQSLHRLADQLNQDGTREYTRSEPPPAAPEPVSTQEPPRPPSHRRRYLVLAAALLLVLAGGIAYAAQLGGSKRPGPATAAGTRSPHHRAGGSPTGTRSPHHQPSPGPTGTPSDRGQGAGQSTGAATHQAGHKRASSTGHAQPPAGQGGKVAFLRTYYSTVPDDLDAGWSMLGPDEKSVGRGSYDRFWGSMASVEVSDIATTAGSHTADITLTYHYKDGRVVVERQRLTLVRSAGGHWLIDKDQVLSSRTR